MEKCGKRFPPLPPLMPKAASSPRPVNGKRELSRWWRRTNQFKRRTLEGERSNLELYKQGKPSHEEPKKKIVLAAVAVPTAKDASAGAKQEQFKALLAEKPVIPEGVVYKKTTADINRKAFDMLWQVFLAGNRKAAADDLAPTS